MKEKAREIEEAEKQKLLALAYTKRTPKPIHKKEEEKDEVDEEDDEDEEVSDEEDADQEEAALVQPEAENDEARVQAAQDPETENTEARVQAPEDPEAENTEARVQAPQDAHDTQRNNSPGNSSQRDVIPPDNSQAINAPATQDPLQSSSSAQVQAAAAPPTAAPEPASEVTTPIKYRTRSGRVVNSTAQSSTAGSMYSFSANQKSFFEIFRSRSSWKSSSSRQFRRTGWLSADKIL